MRTNSYQQKIERQQQATLTSTTQNLNGKCVYVTFNTQLIYVQPTAHTIIDWSIEGAAAKRLQQQHFICNNFQQIVDTKDANAKRCPFHYPPLNNNIYYFVSFWVSFKFALDFNQLQLAWNLATFGPPISGPIYNQFQWTSTIKIVTYDYI